MPSLWTNVTAAKSSGSDGAQDDILTLDRVLQTVDTICDVRQIPELPQTNIGGIDLRHLSGTDVFNPQGVKARIRGPHLAERDPTFVVVRLVGDNSDVIELFHAALLIGNIHPNVEQPAPTQSIAPSRGQEAKLEL